MAPYSSRPSLTRVDSEPGYRPRFIESKKVDHGQIQDLLSHSSKANQWTNFGPLSYMLEAEIAELLHLPDELSVVACCNATVALHALADMHRVLHGRPLRWVTSSFGFYSSCDGVLQDAAIVDCDQFGMLDIELLNVDEFDGLIVTNIFGQQSDMDRYKQFAEQHQKILLIDSAMGFQVGGHLANSCISLHHTKPWGFGEGGCAIVSRENAPLFREMLSFGHPHPGAPINRLAVNGKISEVACAYLLMRLDQAAQIREGYQREFRRISSIGQKVGLAFLGSDPVHPGTPGSVPFLYPGPVNIEAEPLIPSRKYYFPLADTPTATGIYHRIVNVACHSEMDYFSDSQIEDYLSGLMDLIVGGKQEVI